MNYKDKLLNSSNNPKPNNKSANTIAAKQSITTENNIERTEIDDTKELYAETELFEMAYNILEYCRNDVPSLLTSRTSLHNVLQLLKTYIRVPGSNESVEEELSDDEFMDDGNV